VLVWLGGESTCGRGDPIQPVTDRGCLRGERGGPVGERALLSWMRTVVTRVVSSRTRGRLTRRLPDLRPANLVRAVWYGPRCP